jgi:redox-sensitive bicupin YhaK (pirin superfamily)
MTAGKGIVHSEKVTDDVLATGQHLHGIQTWLALPLEAEEIDPRFEHYPADTIPRTSFDGGNVCVIIGEAYGLSSPVSTESTTVYVELNLDAGASTELPAAQELGVYVVEGAVMVEGERVGAGQFAVLENNAGGTIAADSASRIMICGGDTLEGERTIWWNFVSSSKERLEQARQLWRDGGFPAVPGEEDFIPLPEI